MTFEDDTFESNPPVADAAPAFGAPRFPLNRVLVLLGPYIAIASGGVAAWLSQNFPGLIQHPDSLAATITQGVTFLAGMIITWALHHKYLEGWQRWETYLPAAHAAAAAGDGSGFPSWATALPSGEPHASHLPHRHRRPAHR